MMASRLRTICMDSAFVVGQTLNYIWKLIGIVRGEDACGCVANGEGMDGAKDK